MSEPISVSGAAAAVLSSGVAMVAVFWPGGLEPTTQALIITFGNSLIIFAAVVYARARSTPIAAPVVPKGTEVTVVTPGPAANETVTV